MERISEPAKRAIDSIVDEWLEILDELPEGEKKTELIKRINWCDEWLMAEAPL